MADAKRKLARLRRPHDLDRASIGTGFVGAEDEEFLEDRDSGGRLSGLAPVDLTGFGFDTETDRA
jgi:hypothetical protein